MSDITLFIDNWRLGLASLMLGGGFIADAVSDAKGWDDVGIKGILVFAVVFLCREIGRMRAADQARNDAREQTMAVAINSNTSTINANSAELAKLTEATKQQTEYFRSVGQTIIEEQLKKQ